jgi:hypothetical protein
MEAIEYPRPLKITKKKPTWKLVHSAQFYKMKEGKLLIDRTLASKVVKGQKITGWSIEDDKMVKEVNLGIEEDPKMVRIGKYLEERYEKKLIKLLKNYIDACACHTYEDMKEIPPHICEHKIELSQTPN